MARPPVGAGDHDQATGGSDSGRPTDAELVGPGHADRPGWQVASPPLGERGVRPDRGELRQEPRDLG
eukprot:1978354-Prymnesium_polylepis.1